MTAARPIDRDIDDAIERVPRPPFRWQTRILLPLALVTATLALLIGAAWSTLFPGRSVRVVPVMVKTAQAAAGATTVTASGWLEPDPFPIYATALASGIVEDVAVLEGETVTKGQVLARLIAEDAELELRRAESDFAIARADVDRAEANRLAREQTLATLIDRRQSRSVAAARVAESEAAIERLAETIAAEESGLAALHDELERKEALVESGSVSRGEFRRLVLAAEARARQLEATRKQRLILDAQLDRARSDLAAAEEHLERAIDERQALSVAVAEKARAEALLARAAAVRDEARLRLDRMVVRSPVDGVVLSRLVAPGSRLMVGGNEGHSAHVVHLYDPSSLQVRVDVPLADAGSVGVDQRVIVEVQAVPDRKFTARVTRLLHEADIQKNTVEVKASLDDPGPVLKPEMLARVRFLAGDLTVESRQRVLAPERLLGSGTAVWVVASREQGRGVARRRAVTLGDVEIDGWREVTSGLQPGDLLIDAPPADLADGESVTIEGESR